MNLDLKHFSLMQVLKVLQVLSSLKPFTYQLACPNAVHLATYILAGLGPSLHQKKQPAAKRELYYCQILDSAARLTVSNYI